MIKKLLTFFFFFLLVLNTYSQEKNVLVTGKVLDSLGGLKNVTIINLQTKQGTSSNNNGAFRIFLKLGDSLKASSIQHLTKTITVSKYNIDNKTITIFLKPKVYQLDEFELKKHNLSGSLGTDSKGVSINKKDSLLRDVMNFSKVNMKIIEGDDYIDQRVRPHINETDPNAAFVGAGAALSIPFKYSERLWALRKKLAIQKKFPYKILSELGDKFFFDELKIPLESYFHFLEYCNPLGIENLHKEGKLLEVIKILREESKSYLKIIKKE
jgi:hypothetical protein